MIRLVAVLWLFSAWAVFGAPLQDDQDEQDVPQFSEQVLVGIIEKFVVLDKVPVVPRVVFKEFTEELFHPAPPYPQTMARNKLRKHQRNYIFLTGNEDGESPFPSQSDDDSEDEYQCP